MDLNPYIRNLREDLLAAAAIGDEETRRAAALLGAAIEPAGRLAIMNALSDLAAEVTQALDGHVVEVKLDGRELSVSVSRRDGGGVDASAPETGDHFHPEDLRQAMQEAGGELSRTTVRLFNDLKSQAEQKASEQGVSLNTYISRRSRTRCGRRYPRGWVADGIAAATVRADPAGPSPASSRADALFLPHHLLLLPTKELPCTLFSLPDRSPWTSATLRARSTWCSPTPPPPRWKSFPSPGHPLGFLDDMFKSFGGGRGMARMRQFGLGADDTSTADDLAAAARVEHRTTASGGSGAVGIGAVGADTVKIDTMGADTVEIDTDPARNGWRSSFTVTVTAPNGSSVRVKAQSSDVSTTGPAAMADVRTASGTVQLDQVLGKALVQTASGGVRIAGVGGGLDVRTASRRHLGGPGRR